MPKKSIKFESLARSFRVLCRISAQRLSVGDAVKQSGMCAVGAGGGAALGLGYSSGAQMAIDGAFRASLIPVDMLLVR